MVSRFVAAESLANPYFSRFLPSHPALSRVSQISCLFTTNMHQLTGDFYTVGQILGHSLKGIGIQLQLSNNLEAVTAQYVDVRMERKLVVLNTYHEAVLGSGLKT